MIKILLLLQTEMNRPKSYGWFHILCLSLSALTLFYLIKKKVKLEKVLGVYGFIALILEILKQVIWTFTYDEVLGTLVIDYEWYSFPFQLCTTPIYVSIICLFLKNGRVRDALLSYLAFITILGSISTAIFPDSCFVKDILVNIHTMYLHLGSLVVSLYLIISKKVSLNKHSFIASLIVFYIFVSIALLLNITIYNSGILNGEVFNMFYISPYFISVLPVFNVLQTKLPYIIYLFSYLIILSFGGYIIYLIAKSISKIK